MPCPRRMREFLERATEAYVPHLRGHKKSYEDAREVFDNLHEAIQERRVCRVSYRSAMGGERPTLQYRTAAPPAVPGWSIRNFADALLRPAYYYRQ